MDQTNNYTVFTNQPFCGVMSCADCDSRTTSLVESVQSAHDQHKIKVDYKKLVCASGCEQTCEHCGSQIKQSRIVGDWAFFTDSDEVRSRAQSRGFNSSVGLLSCSHCGLQTETCVSWVGVSPSAFKHRKGEYSYAQALLS